MALSHQGLEVIVADNFAARPSKKPTTSQLPTAVNCPSARPTASQLAGAKEFLLLVPSGLYSHRMAVCFMVQRSDFSLAKIQGASGVALDPCVLFLALAGRLVSGLAVTGVGVSVGACAHFWWTWSVFGWPVGCLVSELEAADRVLCLFGSCGWEAGVQTIGSRLGPPIIEARRELDLVTTDGRFSSLGCWLEAACWGRFRFALRLGEDGLGA